MLLDTSTGLAWARPLIGPSLLARPCTSYRLGLSDEYCDASYSSDQ
jgi:hypothetical protein